MDIQFDPISETVVAYRLTIEPADYLETYRQRIKEIRRTAQLPGFRAGQVPASLIEKKHGRKVLIETIVSLGCEWLNEYIEDYNIRGLRSPDLRKIEGLETEDFQNGTVHLEFRQIVCPSLGIDLESLPKFVRYNIELTDADIDGEIRSIRAKAGTARPTQTANLLDQFYQYHLELLPVDTFGNVLDERVPVVAEYLSPIREQEAEMEREPSPASDYLTVSVRYLSWLKGNLNLQLFGKSVNDQWRSNWSELMGDDKTMPLMDESVPPLLKEIFLSHDFIIRVTRIEEITPHAIDAELHQALFPNQPYIDPEGFRNEVRNSLEEQIVRLSNEHLERQLLTYLMNRYPIKLHSSDLMQSFVDEVRSKVEEFDKLDDQWFNANYSRLLHHLLNEAYFIELAVALGDQLDVSQQAFEEYLYDYFQAAIADLSDEQYSLLPTVEEDGETVINLDLIIATSMKDPEFQLERARHFRRTAINSSLWESGLLDLEPADTNLEEFRRIFAMPVTYEA